jgi:hypothetical protein
MSAYAAQSERTSKFGPYAAHLDDDFGRASMELDPGQRLGGPVRRRRGRALLRLLLVCLLIGGGAWAWLNHQATIEQWSASVASMVTPMLSRSAPGPVASSRPVPELPPAPPPLETREAPAATAVPSSATALLPAQGTPQSEPENDDAPATAEKLPPIVADPSDPLQVRALAAGLHPGLSRALLTRLSDADFRNAEIAIKTAIVETRDKQVFEYPKKRAADLALFQVKFVPGVTADCRRYVVMVTKDRWLTTAMPMEKCGVKMKPEKQARR